MADGRKNNGGHSTKGFAGRKSKAEEFKLAEQGISAIETVYGSVSSFWEHIAKQSRDSFPHLKMLVEYVYGKPKEMKQEQEEQKEIPKLEVIIKK